MVDQLQFHRSIYRLDAIEETISLYRQLGTVEFDVNEHDIIVRFTDFPPEIMSELKGRFANHALFETILRHRREHGGDL